MNEEATTGGNQFRMALPAENRGGRRVQGGVATSDVTLSAHVGGNAEVFAQIMQLHVLKGQSWRM